RVDEPQSRDHEDHDHPDLQRHHEVGGACRLADTDVAERTHRRHDEHGGHVDDRAGRHQVAGGAFLQGGVDPDPREVDVHLGEEVYHVRRPAHRHRGGRYRVFEQQIPAYEPGGRL